MTENRYGIVISNKISKLAVVRNKLRRQIRAILAGQKTAVKGFDILMIVKKEALAAGFDRLEQAVKQVLAAIGLV